nr:protein trichome birefringence-like 2 [Tanacetum cinerariifolium]
MAVHAPWEDYKCTVVYIKSPFLVRESSSKGKNGSFVTLRLDLMDSMTSLYEDADILIFNTGHWWTHEKTSRGKNYYQEGNHIYSRLKVHDAYTRALSTWAKWVDNNIDSRKTQVIFMGYAISHFRGGQWNSGGKCHKETEPIFNTSHLTNYPPKMQAFDSVLGHPSIYRRFHKPIKPQVGALPPQDCSHWCLPGVPDTWNELLYVSILKME